MATEPLPNEQLPSWLVAGTSGTFVKELPWSQNPVKVHWENGRVMCVRYERILLVHQDENDDELAAQKGIDTTHCYTKNQYLYIISKHEEQEELKRTQIVEAHS